MLACFWGHVIILGVTNSLGLFYVEFQDAFPDFNKPIAFILSLNAGCLYSPSKESEYISNKSTQ